MDCGAFLAIFGLEMKDLQWWNIAIFTWDLSSCCHVYLMVSPRKKRPSSPCVSLENCPFTEDLAVRNCDFHSYLKLPEGDPKSFASLSYSILLHIPLNMSILGGMPHFSDAHKSSGWLYTSFIPRPRKLVGYIFPCIDGRWITSWLYIYIYT